MPSIQTLSRAVVMILVGAVLVKGWQLYGPTDSQLQSAIAQAKDFGNSLRSRWHQGPAANQRLVAPGSRAAENVALVPQAPSPNPAPALTTQAPATLPPAPVLLREATAPAAPSPPDNAVPKPNDRLEPLMVRLQELGATDPKLVPWGTGDRASYRFSCRVPLPRAPLLLQHFEAVAPEPAGAVEAVLAKIESRQVTPFGSSTLAATQPGTTQPGSVAQR
ncbi:MAG: hypothetical protein IT425_11375 [Pirellulales bacterium]|nr:hypothetical protein [Pirellulales bacterium]